jgi:hypothetical protein
MQKKNVRVNSLGKFSFQKKKKKKKFLSIWHDWLTRKKNTKESEQVKENEAK